MSDAAAPEPEEPSTDRLAPNPGDAPPISRIEVHFALPVYLTAAQDRQLQRLLDDVVGARWNQVRRIMDKLD